jgi:hypothetical protein
MPCVINRVDGNLSIRQLANSIYSQLDSQMIPLQELNNGRLVSNSDWLLSCPLV